MATAAGRAQDEPQDQPEEEPQISEPTAAEVQEQLKQWVLTRQLISKERSSWEEQKETWKNLNEIRTQESTQLQEFTSTAKARVQKLSEKQKSLSDEKKALRSWRTEAVEEVVYLETSLIPLLPTFPTPLRQSLREPLSRLEGTKDDVERSVQDRARDVIVILQAYREFHNTITLNREVLPLGDQEREVEILYLGMSRAWFVDAQNKVSGKGLPSADGWVWTEDPALASTVRRAIAMRKNEAPPEFLELPLQLRTEEAP